MTKEGLAGLIEASSCKVWLYPEDDAVGPLVNTESGLKLCALPSLEWMLDNEGQERYPYEKTFGEAKWDEIVIIHTSGTTGKLSETICYLTSSFLLRRTQAYFSHKWHVERIREYAHTESKTLAPRH